MHYPLYGITPEELAFYQKDWLEHDSLAAMANIKETRELDAKTNFNPKATMENTNQQPLICYGIFPNNIAGNAPKPSVQLVTESKPDDYWKTTGYVNGEPICSSYSKDRKHNIKDVTEILAAGGHHVPKELAPVMSAIMPKKAKSNRLDFPDAPETITDAFLSDNGCTDVGTAKVA